ncbi:HTH_Tnp_Tc3_2 domain-containing protein [Trichonephila clavipes]|nr:HTH_Tnp_Tc3_2 domain-containing protein [Trichonephila clavipes]
MEVPLRTAYGQNGRCGMQPKAKHKSSRAGAAKTRTETCEIVEEKQNSWTLEREKENARGRLESGQTQRSVADAVGVARSVVSRLWNRFQETGNVRRRPGAGHPRATTSTDDRYIQLTARRNRTENATRLQRQLLLATGRMVSSQTVRNRLHEGGLYARRPMVCIPLTPRHRAARRRWAAEHRDWE